MGHPMAERAVSREAGQVQNDVTNPGQPSTTPDPLIGRLLADRFKITALIARGGMGKVYRAEQAPLGRACAVKVLNSNFSGQDPEFHKRFFLEASIGSKLSHPNTVTIFDYGQTADGIYFMAMEYLEGRTLRRAIKQAGHLDEERAAHIARQVCRALREAHEHGVIHRDLKPANIFLVAHGDESDFVKVLDFGLVKAVGDNPTDELTQTGVFMGSPKYMAPEQIRGEKVDHRTDIYALGVILYEMLTGRVPFERASHVNTLMAHVTDPVPPIAEANPKAVVSPGLEDLIMRCLAKNPDERPASMGDVLRILRPVGTLTTSSAYAVGANVGVGSAPGSGESHAPSSRSFEAHAPSSTGSQIARRALRAFDLLPRIETPRPAGLLESMAPPPVALSRSPLSAPPPPPEEFPTDRDEAAGRLSRRPMVALLGFACIALTAIAIVTSRPVPPRPLEPHYDEQTAAASPGTEGSGTAAATAGGSASQVAAHPSRVHLSSEPEGAVVKEGTTEVCAATPCEVLLREGGRPRTLTFSRQGFHTETRRVGAGDERVVVRLAKDAPPVFVPPPPPAKPPQDSTPVPRGFKDLPY
jgi:serine/threonine-protein kinase